MYLTDTDRTILPIATRDRGGFHVATQWYLKGWSPLPYQYVFHNVPALNVSWKAGIGCGKTTTTAASIVVDCLSIPEFRALSTSVTAKQAELTYQAFTQWLERNSNLEHHIVDITRRPWPVITFKNYSTWEIRTAGNNAANIRGSEFDRITFDEPELDMRGEIVSVLRGRLRGRRSYGTERMCRLDLTGTPSDALWWIERFKRGQPGNELSDMTNYFSLLTTTYENTHITKRQIQLMEAEYTDEQIKVELEGQDPDYGAAFFPKVHINECISQALNDRVTNALYPENGSPEPGFILEEHPRHGILKYETPVSLSGIYVMAGDPGTDDPPKRNSGCIAVADISKNPAKLVYFDWVAGHGSYKPFMNAYSYAFRKYMPLVKFVDTTGPQKAIGELGFENYGIEVDSMNFSSDKQAALNSLSVLITSHGIMMPVSKGIVRQLSSYTKEVDTDKKFPQDIVMTLAMLALAIRQVQYVEEVDNTSDRPSRSYRRNHRNRTTRSRK